MNKEKYQQLYRAARIIQDIPDTDEYSRQYREFYVRHGQIWDDIWYQTLIDPDQAGINTPVTFTPIRLLFKREWQIPVMRDVKRDLIRRFYNAGRLP